MDTQENLYVTSFVSLLKELKELYLAIDLTGICRVECVVLICKRSSRLIYSQHGGVKLSPR